MDLNADAKKDIIRIMNSMAGRFSGYQIFSDWVECAAIAISNACRLFHDDIWKSREDRYMAIMQKYTDAEKQKLAEMFALLAEAYEQSLSDVLGEIYMDAQLGSKVTGQFFTPYHLSELCNELASNPLDLQTDEPIDVLEPSCGAGGMIIAKASMLSKAGVNYQKRMRVVAQDLDWRCVYMCYVQLSLLGIDAIVAQGDSLMEPYTQGYDRSRVLVTPRRAGCLV